MIGDSLEIGGKRIACHRTVHWSDSGLVHLSGRHGCRDRKLPVDLVVVHWTAGERTAKQSYGFAQRLRYGYQIAIDRDGIIWQHCDPARTVTQHGGPLVNSRSVGVVMTCYGFVSGDQQPPLIGRDRPTYSTRLHGRPRKLAGYYPAQLDALGRVVEALCDTLDIPRQVPSGPDAVMMRGQLARFRGVVGHYHVSGAKSDPGPAPINWLRERWRT